eukprot:365771-Chlamydomonas_euryale.AAC.8
MAATWLRQGCNMAATGLQQGFNTAATGLQHNCNTGEIWLQHGCNRAATGLQQGLNRAATSRHILAIWLLQLACKACQYATSYAPRSMLSQILATAAARFSNHQLLTQPAP